jgi:hypothetical protein
MKKPVLFFLLIGLLTFMPSVNAETESAEAPAADAPETLAPATDEETVAENLEFVSGEVTSSDGTAKTIAVKLYGETETSGDKSLTIQVADTTDITDGEKDRDFASLAPGTEVDVEYDPATAKATYIFIY